MSALSYFNEPAPLAWDVAAAIFGSTGEGGLYDPSSLDTIFQDANGTTPAVPGSPVGLVLDARKDLGPERVTNGTFDTDLSGWDGIANVSATWVDGEVQITGVGAINAHNNNWFTQLVLEPDDSKLWQVRFDATWVSGGNLQVGTGFNVRATVTPNTGKTTYTLITPRGTTSAEVYHDRLTFGGPAGAVWRLDNISVREVLNPPLSQPTTSARPILARMPKTGRRNLLTWTEDISVGSPPWTAIGSTVIEGPNRFSGNRIQNRTNIGPVTAGTKISVSVDITPDPDVTQVSLRIRQSNEAGVPGIPSSPIFDFSTPSAPPEGGTMTPLPGGGWKLTYTGTTSADVDAVNLFLSVLTTTGGRGVFVTNFQGEIGEPTPYQKVTNAYDVTEEGVPDTYSLVYDLADDNLTTTLPQAVNGDLLIAGTKGSIIEPVSYAAGSTFTLGPDTYTGGTPGIMQAVGDIVGVVLIDRTLTQTERDVLIEHYKGKGAKGLLVPGQELVTSELTWDIPTGGVQNSPNSFTFTASVAGSLAASPSITATTNVQGPLAVSFDVTSTSGVGFRPDVIGVNYVRNGSFLLVGPLVNPPGRIRFYVAANTTGTLSNLSVRELRPQEDWT